MTLRLFVRFFALHAVFVSLLFGRMPFFVGVSIPFEKFLEAAVIDGIKCQKEQSDYYEHNDCLELETEFGRMEISFCVRMVAFNQFLDVLVFGLNWLVFALEEG